jgi:hypothetical protein
MSGKAEHAPNNPSTAERGSRVLRNLNAIGAVALGGAGLVLGSGALVGLGALDAAQAGFFEGTRRMAARRGSQKPK